MADLKPIAMPTGCEFVEIGELVPYAKNPKEHTDKDIDLIIKSIQRNGWGDPILVCPETKEILSGNGRYLAAKKIGLEMLPVVYAPDGLTEKQKADLVIASNKLVEASGYNDNLGDLVAEFDLDLGDFGMDVTIESEPKEIIEDEVPETVQTRCKRGDIWQLGNHRLMCGDSTNIDDIDKLMNGQKADMVYEDPPYGMYLDTDYSDMKGFFGKSNKFEKVIGDNDDFKPELITTTLSFFDYCKEIFLWGADYYAETITNRNDGSWIVWDKSIDDSGDKMFGSNFELCWSKNRHKRELARVKWKGLFGMEKDDTKHRVHPTQKPSLLAQWFLDRYSKDNQSIVDLFGGSGSTLIACEQLNRKCFMMELDEHYCDVIIQRWENLTGKQAVKL